MTLLFAQSRVHKNILKSRGDISWNRKNNVCLVTFVRINNNRLNWIIWVNCYVVFIFLKTPLLYFKIATSVTQRQMPRNLSLTWLPLKFIQKIWIWYLKFLMSIVLVIQSCKTYKMKKNGLKIALLLNFT